MLKESYEYIMDDDSEMIVIPVSGDGNGSRWLDVICKKYPDIRTNYMAALSNGLLKTGSIFFTYTGLFQGKHVGLAVTRTSSNMTTREMSMRNILEQLQMFCRKHHIKDVCMVRMGVKDEGLSWEHWVRKQYIRVLEYETETLYKVYIY